MPQPDHIVIVVEENHDADQVIHSNNAPYINDVLIKNGLDYANAHGTDHPSQPNYLELFAGANPGVQGVNSPLQQHYPAGAENTPGAQNALNHGDDFNTGQPFSVANLGSELLAAGKSFAGYSEDQPSVGFTGAQANGINGNRSYVEKHNAWAQFQGSGPNQLPAATNQPFTAFQATTDFSNLPTVSFVVPNEYNDMHDTVSKTGLYADPTKGKDANGNPLDKNGNPVNDAATIQNGDAWLQNNIEAYRQWATTHNSLLITVWDENDYDFTNANNIPMIVDGDPRLVQTGINNDYVNHFDLLKTVEADYGLGLTGAAATAAGLATGPSGQLRANSVYFGDIAHDPATPAGKIYQLYEGILGRDPEPLGFENSVAAAKAGLPLTSLSQNILASSEHTGRFGDIATESNATFVNQLYGSALHRTATSSEVQNWNNAIAAGESRAQVALDISTSPEATNNLASTLGAGVFVPDQTDSAVARLYHGLLNRAPDQVGLAGWENFVKNGSTLEATANSFLTSPEGSGHLGGLDNSSFVNALYQGALGRSDAGDPGAQGWINALGTGVTRAQVALGISESAEAVQHLAPAVQAGFTLT